MAHMWTYFNVLIFLLAFSGCTLAQDEEDHPIVETKHGPIRGTKLTATTGKEYYAFLGIRYAKPPVGNLRFKAPSPPEPWKSTYDATNEGSFCLQCLPYIGVIGDEDCLFLNLYTNKLKNNTEERRPVIVVIHGGGFIMGTGSSYIYGPDHLVDQDVLIITINYRLGILGFLSLNDAGVPGNNGLKDQTMALRWVKDNIADFGGDPDNVIINGESAGAASVHLHFFSPMSKGLFHGAIIQSGTGFHRWAFVEPTAIRRKAFQVGERINCSTSDSHKLLQCLQEESAEKIVRAVGMDLGTYKFTEIMAFIPTTEEGYTGEEEIFLPGKPEELLCSGKFHDVPFIIGVNSREMVIIVDAYKRFIGPVDNNILKDMIDNSLSLAYPLKSKEITEKIWKHYVGEEPWSENMKDNFTQMASDLIFVRDTSHAVHLHTEKSQSPVYMYQLSFEGHLGIVKNLIETDLKGVSHADDLGYMFNIPILPNSVEEDSDEMTTMMRIIKMWTNFAKTKNPTPTMDNILTVKWIPASKMKYVYLNIDKTLSMEQDIHKESIFFLENVL